MIDLHTHTSLSVGKLTPAELIRRAETKGYRILGITDDADLSTLEGLVPVLREAAAIENEREKMVVIASLPTMLWMRSRRTKHSSFATVLLLKRCNTKCCRS